MGQWSPAERKQIRDWLSGQSWTLSGFYKLGGGAVFSSKSPYFAVLGGFGIGGKAFTEAHTKSHEEWVRSIRRLFNF
jgi:hypothetical protein